MADASVALEASNLFSLSANFNTTASTTSEGSTAVNVMDEVGNVACETIITDITNYTQSASYCGSDFMTDIGTFLTEFGNAQNSKVVTGLSINMTAGGYVTTDITGHNHAENAHVAGLTLGYADVSDFLPHEVGEAFASWDGFGIPADYDITTGTDSSASSASVTFAMNHVDQIDETGDHLVGKNITPRCELSMDFVGIPTSNTQALLNADFAAATNDMLGCVWDSDDSNDSNSDFDTFALTGHAHTDLATA